MKYSTTDCTDTAQGLANLGGSAQRGGNGDGGMILTQRHRDTKAQRCLEVGFANANSKISLRTLRLCVRHPRAHSSVPLCLCVKKCRSAVGFQCYRWFRNGWLCVEFTTDCTDTAQAPSSRCLRELYPHAKETIS